MAELLTLRKFEALSPFEIKNELIKLGQGELQDDPIGLPERRPGQSQLDRDRAARRLLPARPVRHHREQARDGPAPGIGGMPQAKGIASRLEAWLAKHADMPGAAFLSSMVPFAIKTFSFEPRCLRPRARRLDHRRQLPRARPHARPQRADRARVSDVGDVRRSRTHPASSTSTRSRAARPRCATSSSR